MASPFTELGHGPAAAAVAGRLSKLVEARVFAAPLVGAHHAAAWWQDHGQLFLVGATAVMLAALCLVG